MTTGANVVVVVVSSAILSVCCSGVSITTVTLGKDVGVGVGSGLALLPPPNTITRLRYKPNVMAKNLNGFMSASSCRPARCGLLAQSFNRACGWMSSIQLWEDGEGIAHASRWSVSAHIADVPRFSLWAVLDFPRPAELLGVAVQ